jgi:hypothetical protein
MQSGVICGLLLSPAPDKVRCNANQTPKRHKTTDSDAARNVILSACAIL